MICCIEVRLTIPDNEARTALATLRRLGVAVGALERADLYRFDVAGDAASALVATFAELETLYNPNKHAMRVREEVRPRPGEVWIDESGETSDDGRTDAVRIGGRALAGVRKMTRCVVWRLFDDGGGPASARVVSAAAERLLCNSAFQRAYV